MTRYTVYVDDNFHHGDESERYELGQFATADEAIAAAKEARLCTELELVQAARDTLDRATMPLAAVLMDSVVKEAVSGKKLGDL